jgi:DNA gyrase/topoisomerase IV subunit B
MQTKDIKKLKDEEHVRSRPDTFVGNVNNVVACVPSLYENADLIVYKDVQSNSAILKLFDEIITNASDNIISSKNVKQL